jgi:hypothetical protein
MPDKLPMLETLDALLAEFEKDRLTTLPDTHPAYALIGSVAAEWANLEHKLDKTIWDLLGRDDARAACVTAQLMGIMPRYKAIISLLTLQSRTPARERAAKNLIKKVNALMRKSHGPSEKRNRYVHDAWYMKAASGQPGQFRAMPFKEPHFGVKDIDLTEVGSTLADIQKLSNEAGRLNAMVYAALVAWQERPQLGMLGPHFP